jgi:hypothetical protein
MHCIWNYSLVLTSRFQLCNDLRSTQVIEEAMSQHFMKSERPSLRGHHLHSGAISHINNVQHSAPL